MTHQFAVTSVISIDHIRFAGAPERVSAGSCGLYLARALAALGADVRYAGACGTGFAREMLAPLDEAGAQVALIRLDGPNARLDLAYDAAGDVSSVHYDEGIGAQFRAAHLPADFWEAQVLWLGTAPYALQVEVARRGKQSGKPVYLSTQGEFAGKADQLAALIPDLSALFANSGELATYGFGGLRPALDTLLRLNPALTIVATRGSRGSWVFSGGQMVAVPAAPVEALSSTVGAGDTFAAAFALQTLRGAALACRLQWAACAAVLRMQAAAGHAGPTAADVDARCAAVDLPARSAALDSPQAAEWIAAEAPFIGRSL